MGLTEEQYKEAETVRLAFEEKLQAAFTEGDPTNALAKEAVGLHKEWLCYFYPNYNKDYHKGLADMYVADPRFRENYDKFGAGCTEFLRDAIFIFCS